MSRTERIDAYIRKVSEPQLAGMHNPWRDACSTEVSDKGSLLRKSRLRRHMMVSNPRLIIVGEAPGYQGCRYSGIAFTSERLLVEGGIPRMNGPDGKRISTRELPWSEPSATIVWGGLREHGLANDTVMTNAVPWHPEGDRGPHSNRTPSKPEKAAGAPYLKMFLNIYPNVQVAALGNTASDSLTELGIKHVKLRHPANGGATKFRAGLADLVAKGI